ncbi:MAG: hypothetical protein HRU75_07770 [Planctomycetia bacterium]|nr:MAG: hypothetical protein HRU75_07770 [Planctomycetia bacterium]
MPNDEQDFDWSAVIARCLAYLCLKNSKYADAQLLEQAAFLERLGLPAGDRADVLGSSRDSLGVLARRAKKKNGGKKNGKGKRR